MFQVAVERTDAEWMPLGLRCMQPRHRLQSTDSTHIVPASRRRRSLLLQGVHGSRLCSIVKRDNASIFSRISGINLDTHVVPLTSGSFQAASSEDSIHL